MWRLSRGRVRRRKSVMEGGCYVRVIGILDSESPALRTHVKTIVAAFAPLGASARLVWAKPSVLYL